MTHTDVHRGDPFSHPSGSSAGSEKLFCFFFLFKSFFVLVFLSIDRAPNSLWRVQKTFSSGPCSFSLKYFWFADTCRQAPVSNPLVTHGTVESPAKLFSNSFTIC